MVMRTGQFDRWRKPEHPEETTDLRQVTDETFLLEITLIYKTSKV